MMWKLIFLDGGYCNEIASIVYIPIYTILSEKYLCDKYRGLSRESKHQNRLVLEPVSEPSGAWIQGLSIIKMFCSTYKKYNNEGQRTQ